MKLCGTGVSYLCFGAAVACILELTNGNHLNMTTLDEINMNIHLSQVSGFVNHSDFWVLTRILA